MKKRLTVATVGLVVIPGIVALGIAGGKTGRAVAIALALSLAFLIITLYLEALDKMGG